MTKSKLVDLELDLIHETSKAIMVTDGKVECWLPKSLIEMEETTVANRYTVTLPRYIAEERGLA